VSTAPGGKGDGGGGSGAEDYVGGGPGGGYGTDGHAYNDDDGYSNEHGSGSAAAEVFAGSESRINFGNVAWLVLFGW
jgi:hypothetical protein